MQPPNGRIPRGLDWLVAFGISENDVTGINPCVPGEFTMAEARYVNSATPNVVYAAGEEGSLPLVAGRWFMIPVSVVGKYPQLTEGVVPVARAARLIPS
ncbi:MAG TPA: hypothetical protein VF221_23700 [Chloroflexota bacterium]